MLYNFSSMLRYFYILGTTPPVEGLFVQIGTYGKHGGWHTPAVQAASGGSLLRREKRGFVARVETEKKGVWHIPAACLGAEGFSVQTGTENKGHGRSLLSRLRVAGTY